MLLERSDLAVPRVLERMAGLQAQYAPAMYVGLWTRMAALDRLFVIVVETESGRDPDHMRLLARPDGDIRLAPAFSSMQLATTFLAQAQESGGRMPGAPSRWNAKKDMRWEPLRIELVAEVAYEHLQGDRFRHTARFQRWRTDRNPSSCTYDQLEAPVPHELAEIFGL